ncbi:hypothetical protein K8I85_15390, partial [bacterium]|nr:hypothetical protein [bacterium]
VGYVASSAYLVRGSAASAQALRGAASVARVDLLREEWRVPPDLDAEALFASGDALVYVDVFDGEDVDAVAARVRGEGVNVLRADSAPGPSRLIVSLAPGQLSALSALSEVEWGSSPFRSPCCATTGRDG